MTQREFVEQYVLNAARGAGRYPLSIPGAVKEALDAWELMEKRVPATTEQP